MKLKLELVLLVALSAMIVTAGATTASALTSSDSDVSCEFRNSNFALMSIGSDGNQDAYLSGDGEVRCDAKIVSSDKGRRTGGFAHRKKAYTDVLGTSGDEPENVGGALMSVQCKGRGEGLICTGGGLAPVKREVVVVKDLGDETDEYTGKVADVRPDKGSSPVPEPTAALLFGAGLVVAGAATRRKA